MRGNSRAARPDRPSRAKLTGDQIVLLVVGIVLAVAILIAAWVLRGVFFQ